MRTVAGLLVVALYVACSTDLESQISGPWYLRMPPTFAVDERYRMTIRDGVVAFTSTGLIWAAYDVVRPHDPTHRAADVAATRTPPDGSH